MVTLNKEFLFNNILLTECTKTKIILIHTSANLSDYFIGLGVRHNQKYPKIPTLTIGLNGEIYQHLSFNTVVQFFDNDSLNRQAIVIALENVGWLNQHEDGSFTDWKGIKYEDMVLDATWRNKRFWANYSEKQFLALVQLIDYLCIGCSINKKFIGNNVFNNKSLEYEGIITRSCFSKNHFDLSPAFDYHSFNQLINEQHN